MKRLLVLFSLLTVSNVWSQSLHMERTGYRGSLLFFVETQVSLNTETIYHDDNMIEVIVPIVTPKIRIGIPLGEFATDRMMNASERPIGQNINVEHVQYKIDWDGSETNAWHVIPRHAGANGDSTITLLDTLLKAESRVRISFKERGKGVFQIVNIEKRNPIPMIGSILQGRSGDLTIARLRNLLARQKDFPEGSLPLNRSHIKVHTGNEVSLIFYRQSVYPDSSILHRLILDTDTSRWQRTGHFYLLNNLKSNRTYFFEVKYDGSESSRSYEITVPPEWYQKPSSVLILLLMVLLMAAAASYFILRFKWNREKRKRAQNLLRLKAVQAQLNPHFIFNALSTIQGLINMDKKVEANQYLTNFSDVLRHTLTSGDAMFVPLVSELELLKNYLDIEQLRFQFVYHLSVDPSLNTHDIEVPPMLLQPSIENAIKHGIGNKGRDGSINLTIKKEKDGFYIEISDNGRWINTSEKGYGLALTEERIAVVNELGKERKITYQINRNSDGTAIRFVFENWLL